MAVILITHDLGVVAEFVDRVIVMYAGRVAETAGVHAIFEAPLHPYTEGLLGSIPSLDDERERLQAIPGVVPSPFDLPPGCRFAPRCPYARPACDAGEPAADGAAARPSRRLHPPHRLPVRAPGRGERLMSAADGNLARGRGADQALPDHAAACSLRARWARCARSTASTSRSGAARPSGWSASPAAARAPPGGMLIRLIEPTRGRDPLRGPADLQGLDARAMRALRREMQIIFQDPFGALNPRMAVQDIIAEPLVVHRWRTRAEQRRRVRELLEVVGLASYHAERFPHEFSGGQRQRIGIARALALSPKFIICDEPVSALDVSIQAQIINLMQDLQAELGLTYLFISHDLGVVKHIADRVAVMYLGKIVEIADKKRLYANPRHPYTQGLHGVDPGAAPRPPARAHGGARRRAEPERSALRLPLPHALPARHGGVPAPRAAAAER